MKKKTAVSVLLSSILILSISIKSYACTSLYVGKKVSESGNTYIARSEDIGEFHTKVFTVNPAKNHKKGEKYTDSNGFSIEYPSHTYRYTLVRDSIDSGEGNNAYPEAGINEKCGCYSDCFNSE